ncbi:MAG: hypothetical protein IPN18_08030 [Ignavibacteriales bacterium]|nr:hypothetical protein [Ignavibacteriales bacterium]
MNHRKRKRLQSIPLRENAVGKAGSLRRRSQLLNLRNDISTVELRGNVPTRIKISR